MNATEEFNSTLDRLKIAPAAERAELLNSLPLIVAKLPAEPVQMRARNLSADEESQLENVRAMMLWPEYRDYPARLSRLVAIARELRGF